MDTDKENHNNKKLDIANEKVKKKFNRIKIKIGELNSDKPDINNQNNINKNNNDAKSTQINSNDIDKNDIHKINEEIKTNQINLIQINEERKYKKEDESKSGQIILKDKNKDNINKFEKEIINEKNIVIIEKNKESKEEKNNEANKENIQEIKEEKNKEKNVEDYKGNFKEKNNEKSNGINKQENNKTNEGKNDLIKNIKVQNELDSNDQEQIKKEITNDEINEKEESIIPETNIPLNEVPEKSEKNLFEKTSFSINILSKKKIINEIEKNINFSIIEIDYGNDLSYFSKIKPKGLENLGGCCYMNSTLQCLYHIKEFTNYIFKNRKTIQKNNGLISTGLLDTFEGLSKQDLYHYYSPQKFLNNLIEIDDSFKGSKGNDSGDLLSTILTACQEELGQDSDPQDMSLDQKQENLIFSDLFHKNIEVSSIIYELFSYYIRIKNICFECGAIYYSINIDYMIIFNLEQVFRMNSNDLTTSSYNRVVSIENCLSTFSFDKSSFCLKGILCKYCNKVSNKFSVKSFATLPKYLIMVMYRGKDEKFECKVDFKEYLDLKESYYNVKGVPIEKSTKYSLFCGTILYGSKGYGHTIAFCKHFDNKYYIFNDTTTRKTDFNEIQKQKIYLLIYKKNDK